MQRIDLLHIDTEGYDFEILKTIDFSVIQPAVILYETKHLSPCDQQASVELLSRYGYQIQLLGADALAVLNTSAIFSPPLAVVG